MCSVTEINSWIDAVDFYDLEQWLDGVKGQYFVINKDGTFSVENTSLDNYVPELGIYDWELNAATWAKCYGAHKNEYDVCSLNLGMLMLVLRFNVYSYTYQGRDCFRLD